LRYASFVIRLWLPDTPNHSEPVGLRGSIEHIQSGRVLQITDPEKIGPALLELLESTQRTEEAKDLTKKNK
jgi:hypothetical protein